jgi:hypothetical protein
MSKDEKRHAQEAVLNPRLLALPVPGHGAFGGPTQL